MAVFISCLLSRIGASAGQSGRTVKCCTWELQGDEGHSGPSWGSGGWGGGHSS